MNISEVRVKLATDNKPGDDRLLAYASITFDDAWVTRDLKVIEGSKGRFVAMPSRSLKDRCGRCDRKNGVQARYCSDCGHRLADDRAEVDEATGRSKLHADICHPINAACRQLVQDAVLAAYDAELERSRLPGYVPMYDGPGPRNGGPLSARMAAAEGRVA